jgi:chromosome segregation ATPase
MKSITFGSLGAHVVLGVVLRQQAPIDKVVKMLRDIKDEVEADGRSEQKSYDKFACWCEETVSQKAKDINTAKDDIEDNQKTVVKYSGDLGGHRAEIKQLQKDIEKNKKAQKEATEIRKKENAKYENEKNEGEQCIGAMESAIKVLTGAGAGKKGFLETMQEAQLLSIVAGVRSALSQTVIQHDLSDNDLEIVKRFVADPQDFVAPKTSLLQARNPHGDYAPASSQIQGILKSMYDSFTSDLEKANGEEADKQKNFEELMESKKEELETMEDTLETQTMDEAEKTKAVAESKEIIDRAKEQLEADSKAFTEAKKVCEEKALEFNKRAHLRTQELTGIEKAIEILTDPDAAEKLKAAQDNFLQWSSISSHRSSAKAYTVLRKVAAKSKNLRIGRLAALLQTGGHFDKVITEIDEMIADLRKEEQDDIKHRDRCQGEQNSNSNEIGDLERTISKLDKELNRQNRQKTKLDEAVSELNDSITKTKDDIKELKEMREDEYDEFKQAMKDDEAAIPIIEEAIAELSKFYNNNKIPLDFLQKDPRPNTNFQGDYKGAGGSSTSAVGMMKMIKTDLEMEIKTAREEDAEAEESYIKNRNAMQKTLEKLKASKDLKQKELADLDLKIAKVEKTKEERDDDLDAAKEERDAIEKDCGWVDTHFEDRRTKRKAEIDGLIDAKNYLAGMDSGDELELA